MCPALNGGIVGSVLVVVPTVVVNDMGSVVVPGSGVSVLVVVRPAQFAFEMSVWAGD